MSNGDVRDQMPEMVGQNYAKAGSAQGTGTPNRSAWYSAAESQIGTLRDKCKPKPTLGQICRFPVLRFAMHPPIHAERVFVSLTEGLGSGTFEVHRVRLYDSGAVESLSELSQTQVDEIAAALLPQSEARERLSRLHTGIEISEQDWLVLRQAFA